ncbi:class I SAM-dependent methyltransferase [Candidatus Woesearchaeota archaeon]|nr:class I SAM-dependent methyltransferase [Candidatus Woesearchaeota archaeon]
MNKISARMHSIFLRIFGRSGKTYKALRSILNLEKGKVLDLGGGEGRIAEFFAKNGYKTVILDPSKEMLDLVRDKRIVKKLGKADKIPYGNNTFDLVYCVASFHHFSEGSEKNKINLYEKISKEMIRVVKKNRKIIIIDLNPNKWFLGRMAELFERKKGCIFFPPEEIKKLFRKYNVNVYEHGSGYAVIIIK